MAFVHSLGHSFDPIHDFLLPSIVHHFIFNAVELQVAHRYHHRIGMAGCILRVDRQEGKEEERVKTLK